MESKKFSGIFVPRASFYLWIILLLVLTVAYLNIQVAIPAFLLLIYLVFYNVKSNYDRRKEITKYIENLSLNIDTATKGTLLQFPLPLVVLDLSGTIIWYNSYFKNLFDGEELLEGTIDSVSEELNPQSLDLDSINIRKDVVINNKHFLALGNFVRKDAKSKANDYILLLYFIETTELVTIKKKYEDEKSVIGIIVVDNYDDIMQGIEDSKRPIMLAEIDSKIMQWCNFANGIIRKFERDRYLFIFENQYLEEFKSKKFEILDLIKEIQIGNKIPVTLSIGIGINGNSYIDNFNYASASIDIALGRGGDQVVLKNVDNITFFGGRTKELEKRTRVKARVIAYALRELISQSPQVIIMGHENCDIDSLGAALGVLRVVKSKDKEAYIVLENSNSTIDPFVNKISNSSEYDEVFISKSDALDRITRKTLLIVVDTHRPSYTECPELLKHTNQIVVIDHHRRGADFIQDAILTYQETYASSTCELIAEILLYVDESIKLTPIEAEALYAGIVVDTKNFTFNTGTRTFEAAAYLKRHGVDTVLVKQMLQNDLDTYINVSNVVRNAEIVHKNIAISTSLATIKNAQLISAQSADQLLSLSGISAAFVLTEFNNSTYISGRSLTDVNVQIILERLGGGGHFTVAGAQLSNTSVDEAKLLLKNAISDYIENLNNEF